MPRYELWYADQNGAKIELLDNVVSFEYTIIDGDTGLVSVVLPSDESRVYNEPQRDRAIQVFRAADGFALELETIGFTRKWTRQTNNDGMKSTVIMSPDANELAERRIVAYQESSEYATFSDTVGDIMYEVAISNLGATGLNATEPERVAAKGLGGFSLYRTSIGPSIAAKLSWQVLKRVFQDLQNTSRTEGDEVFWGIRPVAPDLFVFTTKSDQPGANRSTSGSNPIIFSTQLGNLSNVSYVDDFTQEVNLVYAGGRNVGQSKLIGYASDEDSQYLSKWNTREGYINASGAQSSAELSQVASQHITRNRPKRIFTGTITSTPATPYGGNGWKFGDRVTISDNGDQFDAIVRAVHIKVSNDGLEEIQAKVESV